MDRAHRSPSSAPLALRLLMPPQGQQRRRLGTHAVGSGAKSRCWPRYDPREADRHDELSEFVIAETFWTAAGAFRCTDIAPASSSP